MIALIDADLVAFRSAASANDEPLEVATLRCDKLMRQLIDEVKADNYMCFLTGASNFRKEVNPEYKATRTQEPPRWLQECKEFLITEWNAKLKEYHEADDLLGIWQTEDSIIVSLDKDLKMIPGEHYSWEISTAKWTKAAEHTTTTKFGGLYNFYVQMLVGDTTDNVIGISGIGPVKAKRNLEGCETEQDLFDTVYAMYDDPERFLVNGICLWICQQEGITWAQHLQQTSLIIPEELKPVLEQKCEFMKSFMETT